MPNLTFNQLIPQLSFITLAHIYSELQDDVILNGTETQVVSVRAMEEIESYINSRHAFEQKVFWWRHGQVVCGELSRSREEGL
jgi:hypothetical protein